MLVPMPADIAARLDERPQPIGEGSDILAEPGIMEPSPTEPSLDIFCMRPQPDWDDLDYVHSQAFDCALGSGSERMTQFQFGVFDMDGTGNQAASSSAVGRWRRPAVDCRFEVHSGFVSDRSNAATGRGAERADRRPSSSTQTSSTRQSIGSIMANDSASTVPST
jgi:hypothetical protein